MRATGMPVWIARIVAWQAPRTLSNEHAAAAIVRAVNGDRRENQRQTARARDALAAERRRPRAHTRLS